MCLHKWVCTNVQYKAFFKTLLQTISEKSEILSYSFDESLNEVTQTSEIDLFVKLWDGTDKCVKVMYYCFTFLGHGRHTDILNHYVEMTKGLKLEYFCQISMDDPTVNMKFFESFLSKLKNENYHSLVDIGSCSPHCAVISRAKYQDFLIVLWGKQTVLSTMQCLDCLYWSW